MKLRTKLLASVSALALATGTLAACGDDDHGVQNNTVVVENADSNVGNALENNATDCKTNNDTTICQ